MPPARKSPAKKPPAKKPPAKRPAAKRTAAESPATKPAAAKAPASRPRPEARRDEEGKGAYDISQLYYYGAAVIGVGFLLGGAVAAILGLRTLALPRELQTVRDGVRGLLNGVAFAIPGFLLAWWHLREGRRRDGGPYTDSFWGASLYFHLVSFVALAFVLVGAIGILTSLVDLAVPYCYEERASWELTVNGETVTSSLRQCYPEASEAGRRALDFFLVLAVSVPVWLWHLREGRKLVGAPPGASD